MSKLEIKVNELKIELRNLREQKAVIETRIELLQEVIYKFDELVEEEKENRK